jgi:archaellum biogenesis ATPase FlaH
MNLIKKLLPVLICISVSPTFSENVSAQMGERREKLEAEKVAFFTRELNLTTTEAESFWPVYNDYSNRKDKINRDRKVLYEYITSNKDYMSEDEVQDALTKFITYQNQETSLIESFNKKFLEILPPKKVMMIYVTENQFKAYILKQIRDNRPGPARGF